MSKPFDVLHYGRRLPPGQTERIPHDKQTALKVFGDPEKYIRSGSENPDPSWEADILHSFILPEPIPYIGGKVVKRVRFHEKMWHFALMALNDVKNEGYWDLLAPWGGSYAFRRRAGGSNLSVHSWGIAFDINPEGNPMQVSGSKVKGVLAETARGQELVKLFEEWGFYWGGRWTRPDPMHFQWGNW